MTSLPAPDDGASPVSASDRVAERALREEVRQELKQLLGEGEWGLSPGPQDEERIRVLISERVRDYQRRAAVTNGAVLSDPAGVERRLYDALLGMGPLQIYMDDPDVEELLINAPHRVLCVKNGHKQLLRDVCFEDDQEVRQLVKRLIGPLGKRLDESSPMVDARLPDGSRLNATIPPATTRYCAVAIRKFSLHIQSLAELVERAALPQEAADLLDAAVRSAVAVLLSGGPGAGKTTLLNCLGQSLPASERAITVEETPELRLEARLPDCVALQARAGNVEGEGEIRIRDLIKNALRMRSDRLIVGEVRGGEAFDMLMACNTGHEGSLSTVHANSPRQALDRLATLALTATEHISKQAAREMVAQTMELVVQLRREPRSSRRRVVSIYEVTGLEENVILGQELWAWDRQTDQLRWTGITPRCLAKMADRGVDYALPPVAIGDRR